MCESVTIDGIQIAYLSAIGRFDRKLILDSSTASLVATRQMASTWHAVHQKLYSSFTKSLRYNYWSSWLLSFICIDCVCETVNVRWTCLAVIESSLYGCSLSKFLLSHPQIQSSIWHSAHFLWNVSYLFESLTWTVYQGPFQVIRTFIFPHLLLTHFTKILISF